MKNQFCFLLIFLCNFCCGIYSSSSSPSVLPLFHHPNIIMMLMDDMGWGDLGANGDPNHETPNLDRMAQEGMLMTNFYTANPICSPSRAALLTGRLPIRNGFYTDNILARNSYTPQEIVGGISDYEYLLPEMLSKAGYRNKIVGKWHLGHQEQFLPLKHGFHEFFGSTNCHFGQYDNKDTPNIPFFRDDHMIGRYFENVMIDKSKHLSNLTQDYIQEAINFIKKHDTESSNPFFLYWTPDSHHAPTFRSQKYVGKSFRNSSYGDVLIEIDDGVGKILDLIRKTPSLSNNTLVFFTSDNGPALVSKDDGGSNGGLLCGKQTMFEGGFRVPAIAWWPGMIKPYGISRQASTTMDLFSTIAELIGEKLPSDREYDSHSLVPTLFQNLDQDNRSVFFYHGNLLSAVRVGQYKAHWFSISNPQEEFNLGIDFCPGQYMKGLTQHQLTNHSSNPILFHMGRDYGEKYPISPRSQEYKNVMIKLKDVYRLHIEKMKPGKPVLNWCDKSVMNWSPPGCQKINMCLPTPESKPYKCDWPH